MNKNAPKLNLGLNKLSAEEVAQKAGMGTQETPLSSLLNRFKNLSFESFEESQENTLKTIVSGITYLLENSEKTASPKRTIGKRGKASLGTEMIPGEEAPKKPRAKKAVEELSEDMKCVAVYKSGQKKDQKCGRKVVEGETFCKMHCEKEKSGGKKGKKASSSEKSDPSEIHKKKSLQVKGHSYEFEGESYLLDPTSQILFRKDDDDHFTIFGEIHKNDEGKDTLYALSALSREKYSGAKTITIKSNDLPVFRKPETKGSKIVSEAKEVKKINTRVLEEDSDSEDEKPTPIRRKNVTPPSSEDSEDSDSD